MFQNAGVSVWKSEWNTGRVLFYNYALLISHRLQGIQGKCWLHEASEGFLKFLEMDPREDYKPSSKISISLEAKLIRKTKQNWKRD